MRAVGVAAWATTSKAVSVYFIRHELITIEILETRRVNGSTIPKADQTSLSRNGQSSESEERLTGAGMRTPCPSQYRVQ